MVIPPSCRVARLGYDRDFDELAHGDSIRELASVPSMDVVDPPRLDEHTVTLDPPCQLDLGERQGARRDLIADDVALRRRGRELAAMSRAREGRRALAIS